MEPEDKTMEGFNDFEESADSDESTIDIDHFDEHMDPFDDGPFYRTIDEL